MQAKKGREKEFETALQKLHILKAMRFLCILGFCIRIGPCLHNNRGFILSVAYSQTPHIYIYIYISLKSQLCYCLFQILKYLEIHCVKQVNEVALKSVPILAVIGILVRQQFFLKLYQC